MENPMEIKKKKKKKKKKSAKRVLAWLIHLK